ncbi:MAG: DUF4476 domain-containing protein [Proteobacteria bacterium]|nr:DUF4476 domain-containing protein [Pseudomonadota bacterium]
MKCFKLNALLFSAFALFCFAGNANAKPPHHHNQSSAHHQDKDRCECRGKPGCKCDDRKHGSHSAPAPKPAPVPPPPVKPAPVPPPPVHPGPAPMHPGMPGVGNAVVVMNPGHFSSLIRQIQNEPWTGDKMNLIRREARGNYFSCEQVAALIRRINHDSNRVQMAAELYDRTVDKANWNQVRNALEYDRSRHELDRQLHHR